MRPVQEFVQTESASSVLLILAAFAIAAPFGFAAFLLLPKIPLRHLPLMFER